ncbi:MAG: glycoside hydrolase family 9 protein [Janthinobacterium lividum]
MTAAKRRIKQDNEKDRESRRRFLQSVVAGGIGLIAQRAAASAPVKPRPTRKRTSTPVREGDVIKAPPAKKRVDARIHLNQVGYLPTEPKRAVVPATGFILGNSFVIVDDDVIPTIRYRGILTEYHSPKEEPGHFQHHFYADFDSFSRPGRYRLRISDGHLSVPFSIGENIYEQIVPLILRYFDVQRCGFQHSEHRGPCHVDDGIIVGGPRSGQRIDASGGWHDAGDYLKFVETTSYVAAVMLFAYDHYHSHYDRALAGWEHINGLPLPLAYAQIGLNWLLKMHPSPDEFYYQVGDDTDHDSWRLPERDNPAFQPDWKPRPVFYGIGANLAGRTAAALAIASRLYQPYDRRYAARCLAAAESVYRLGLKNPHVLTTKPADFYPESSWQDDMEWAAIDLYRATGRPAYLHQAMEFARQAGPAHKYTSVYNTHAIAHYTLYAYAPPAVREDLLEYLRIDADYAKQHAQANPYGLGTPYLWGTAEAASGAAITSLVYAELSGNREYTEIARRQRDFILGCNPFSLSCLIGVGTRFPLFPHHQIANIKNIELTGAVVGGPTDLKTYQNEHTSVTDVEFSAQAPSPMPEDDLSGSVSVYHDVVEDYVTNEPANDYTAKFLLLAAFYIGAA